MALYRFEIDEGNQQRVTYITRVHEPRKGEILTIAGVTLIVTQYTPVPEAKKESAGHAGTAVCRLLP